MAKKPVRFPEVSALRLPVGTLALIREAADALDMKPQDWLRAAVDEKFLRDPA